MKRFLIIAILIFVIAPIQSAIAALAVDATTTGNKNGESNSASWSHTTSGSNRSLYLIINYNNELGSTPNAATYNSVAMTQLCTNSGGGGSNNRTGIQIWELVAPASGSNTIAVTSTGSAMIMYAAAISFNGADQSTPSGTCVTTKTDGALSGLTVTASSASGEIVISGAVCRLTTGSAIFDTTGTEFATTDGTVAGAVISSSVYSNGSASVDETWHWSSLDGREGAAAAVGIKPAAADGSAGPLGRRRAQ